MKLLRLKITDPDGFRSLQADFEHHFRAVGDLQEEKGFAPYVCAGPNGSGKSNLLEVLAAIFFQLEVLRVRRSYLPDSFLYDEVDNPTGFKDGDGVPNGFEIEYLIRVPNAFRKLGSPRFAHVSIVKTLGKSSEINWRNQADFAFDSFGAVSERERDFLLPQYVLGYSSGGNEILSLPFFKLRFVQFDEYWNALKNQLSYDGRPETRLAYLDTSFSQAILLCNLLFHDADALKPFREDVGVEALKEFRIIIKRSIEITTEVAEAFRKETLEAGGYGQGAYGQGGYGETDSKNPALVFDSETNRYTVNLMQLLEADSQSADNFDPIVTRLKRCATCSFVDEAADTLYLDYYVNEATKQAFRENFDDSPIALFQALQVLLTLNLYTVSDALKADLYRSDSLYVGETIPVLASDQRIMRIKHFWLKKTDIKEPVLLKSLSDGEHQLLHSLGLCLLFRNTNSLFLLDEPETHFNPDWRSNFISRLHECFPEPQPEKNEENIKEEQFDREMLVTTHTPFLISDSKPEKVMIFKNEHRRVKIIPPNYNTFGASISEISIRTFRKSETLGGYAEKILKDLEDRYDQGGSVEAIIEEINSRLGDSIEKKLLLYKILSSGREE